MLLKRPLKDVGPWRGVFEPSTATSFTERERVGLRSISVWCVTKGKIVTLNYYIYAFLLVSQVSLRYNRKWYGDGIGSMTRMTVDVIIPVYKPGKELFSLIKLLNQQSVSVNQILLMNTEEKYFEQLTYGTRFLEEHKNVKVFHLSKKEFDHGKTRHMGVCRSDAPIFVMMTQDALPADEFLLERLIRPLEGKVAVSYARQLPTKDCSVLESFTRQFNYPEQSMVKSLEDLDRLGIKTYFCSNVCAAYRRDIYDKLGGFVRHTIFNEDMIYAATAMKAGYQIAYEASAQVNHSHNYTNMQQLRRSFDMGVSQAQHPEVFRDVPSESEGKRLVKEATVYLKKNHMTGKLLHFYMQCASKYIGYFLGKHYQSLPNSFLLKITTNKDYWC